MKIPKWFNSAIGIADIPFNNATGSAPDVANYIVPIDWNVEDVTEINWEVDDY